MYKPFFLLFLFFLVACLPYHAVNQAAPTVTNNSAVSPGDVLQEINGARTNPRQYAAYLEQLRPYYKGKHLTKPGQVTLVTKEGAQALEEAIRFLKSTPALPPLTLSAAMSRAALDHVQEQGWNGKTGHQGKGGSTPDKRLARYGAWQHTMGENISYGSETAREIVIDLLIDDGVPDRGHRANIFNADYRVTGIAYGPHSRYGSICVILFSGGFVEK